MRYGLGKMLGIVDGCSDGKLLGQELGTEDSVFVDDILKKCLMENRVKCLVLMIVEVTENYSNSN